MIAASATSNAPWITYAVLNPLSPMMMGVPSVLLRAIVAVPIITEVPRPPELAASGSSKSAKSDLDSFPYPQLLLA